MYLHHLLRSSDINPFIQHEIFYSIKQKKRLFNIVLSQSTAYVNKMSHLLNVISLDANEVVPQIDEFWVTNIDSTTSSTTHETFTSNNNNNNCIENICLPHWRPSDLLLKTLRSLYENDYTQYPCIPCSYCSRLLYPHSIKWIARDQTTIYPFQLSYLLRHIRAIHQKLLCAVIVNLIQIIESIVHLPQYLHVLTMFLMQKENIFPPFSYIPV